MFQQLPKQRPLWLALSGGLDSMVLLHLLHSAGLHFKALHINHQLSPHAEQWQAHCQAACDNLGVELVIKVVTVSRAGRGLEDAARAARFNAFGQVLALNSVLLTAHHLDDQAETLMLRLLRGAGVQGLRGMLPVAPLCIHGRVIGDIYRPLLNCARVELEAYAKHQNLSWVEDESNLDLALDRNFLRHQVLPSIAQRWQGFAERWSATARHLTDATELLSELAEQDLRALAPASAHLGESLDLSFIEHLSSARVNNLMRHWLADLGVNPSCAQLSELLAQLAQAKADAQVNVQLGSLQFRRFQQRVYAVPLMASAPVEPFKLAPNQPCQFGASQIAMRPATLGLAVPASGHWLVRARMEGERAHPAGRQHSQTLKKLLQEANLPPWLRDQLPLVCDGQAIVAVGNLWVEQSAGALVSNGYQLCWEFPQYSRSCTEAD